MTNQIVPFLDSTGKVIGSAEILPVNDKGSIYANIIIDKDKKASFELIYKQNT